MGIFFIIIIDLYLMKAYRKLQFVCIALHCLLIDRKKKKTIYMFWK